MAKHWHHIPRSGIYLRCWKRSQAWTKITFPSGTDKGLTLPLAGGISVKSMYSPARMRSTSLFGRDGRPWARDSFGPGIFSAITGGVWVESVSPLISSDTVCRLGREVCWSLIRGGGFRMVLMEGGRLVGGGILAQLISYGGR